MLPNPIFVNICNFFSETIWEWYVESKVINLRTIEVKLMGKKFKHKSYYIEQKFLEQ
jgi:hypothetical protein